MAKKSANDYFGLNKILSIILAILPPVAWILGVVTRVMEGKIIAALVRFLLGFTIIWIVDLVLMILTGRIWRLINV